MAPTGNAETQLVRMVNSLKEKGLRIDAIGNEGHVGLDYPSIGEYENRTSPSFDRR